MSQHEGPNLPSPVEYWNFQYFCGALECPGTSTTGPRPSLHGTLECHTRPLLQWPWMLHELSKTLMCQGSCSGTLGLGQPAPCSGECLLLNAEESMVWLPWTESPGLAGVPEKTGNFRSLHRNQQCILQMPQALAGTRNHQG